MRLFPWMGSAILILMLCYAPTARAQEDLAESQIDINLESGVEATNATIINAMDETTYALEKDVVLAELPEIEGKYYGPYQQSSLFQFAHTGGYFFFHTNFTIGPEVIMNGASTFWVRVPIVPSQYSVWHLFCDWGYFSSIEGLGSSADRSFGLLLPWIDHDYWYGYDKNLSSGNVWSTSSGNTYNIRIRDSGLYVRYDGVFKPNEQFLLAFWGVLQDGQRPEVYLSAEDLDGIPNQTFRFYEPYEIRDSTGVLLKFGYKYDNNMTLEVNPAWAFLFISGLGKEGMASYKLSFRNPTTDYLEWSRRWVGGAAWPHPVNGYFNDSYFSFYMPFTATCTATESGTSIIRNSIDWKVNLTLYPYHTAWPILSLYPGEFNRSAYALNHTHFLEFYVNDTENYILFSSPYPVSINGTYWPIPEPQNMSIFIRLTPMQQCEIVLLGSDINDDDAFWDLYATGWGHPLTRPYNKIGKFCQYWHENQFASWDSTLSVNSNWLPLFNSLEWTPAQWVEVEETSLYWIYDFGWGTGYYFPGQTSIYMFLDNGGQFFYNGSYESFLKDAKDNRSFWEKLIGAIVKPILTVVGWIWDGLMTVYNTLKNVGNWIISSLLKIVGWIVSCIKDIAGKVSSIVEGMLYGMPMLAILFLVNYVGTALYRGKLPRLTKERKLFRKMRVGRILKQRAKIQRRLKYPIERIKAGVGAAKRERLAIIKWRTERSKARTERYEAQIHRRTASKLKHEESAGKVYRKIGRP